MGELLNYWIIALPRPDMERCLDVGTFGMNYPYLLNRIEVGDKVVFCASKEWLIIADGTITKPYYVSSKRVFLSQSGAFEHRLDFEAKRLEPEHQVDFRSLVAELSFIQNPAKWGPYFMHPIRQMSREDYEFLVGNITGKR